jgi:hypothetical protein
MMEPETANKILKSMYDVEILSKSRYEALETAMAALEKQVPKEIKLEIIEGDEEEAIECCPACRSFAVGNYCLNCGQALQWPNVAVEAIENGKGLRDFLEEE